MLPSMPVLFPRDSQSGDGFTFKHSPLPIFTVPSVPKPLPPPSPKPKASGGQSKKDELPEHTSDDGNQQEINYVQQYYNKICKLPVEKFTKFKDILAGFTPGNESPAQLYRQLETLLGGDELVEEFLTFLTPGQCAEVGRFMDYLVLIKISKFIEQLQTALERKPAKLRKVIKAVTAAAASGSEFDLRMKVEPLIRTNARLLQQFRTLFPNERPPESDYLLEHTEEFPESAWAGDTGYHRIEMEEEPAKDRKGDGDVTYHHGRVFIRQGRVLRPATLTFPGSCLQEHIDRLAPPRDQLLLIPTTNTTVDSDDESKKSPKRQRAKTKKDKKGPETPTKNPEEVSKKAMKVLDARIEKIATKNQEEKEGKGRRKRERSPDEEGAKKKQPKRLDKTEKTEVKEAKQSKKVFDKRKGKAKAKSDAVNTKSHKSERKCVSKVNLKSKSIRDRNVKEDNTVETTDIGEAIQNMTELNDQRTDLENRTKTETIEASQQKHNDNNHNQAENSEIQLYDRKENEMAEAPQQRDEDSTHNQAENSQNKSETQNAEQSGPNWTRSEDKTILLVLKAGSECEDTFLKMRELLPHRSLQELRDRFFHVMDLLRSMALDQAGSA